MSDAGPPARANFLVAVAITGAHTQPALAQGCGKEEGEMTLPGWNAHVKIENATTVGLGWSVPDDEHGKPLDYDALITLALPPPAGPATIVSEKPNETVVLNRDASLACRPNGIEAVVTYRVTSKTGTGHQVSGKVCKNAGEKDPRAGDILGGATGQIGQDITVRVLIPGSCA
jgi:hypothetical protein